MKKLLLFLGIMIATNVIMAQGRPSKEQVQVKLEEYKDRLNLTDDQVAEWKEIRKKYQPQLKDIRSDESLKKSDKKKAAADVIAKIDGEVMAMLNEDQQAEYKVIRSEIKANAKKRRRK